MKETLLKILTFPITLFNYIKVKEKMLLFCAACMHDEIEDPTVWDVDTLHKSLLDFLELVRSNPKFYFSSPKLAIGMFWHLFISLFKKMDFPREDVKMCLDNYTNLKKFLVEITGLPATDEMRKKLGKDADMKIQITPVLVYQVWKDMVGRHVFSFK